MNFKFFTVAIIATVSQMTWAISSYPSDIDSAAKTLYGATASFKYSCDACHISGRSVSGGTAFMKDFYNSAVNAGLSPANLSAAQVQTVIKAMEALDSDGDKATTSQELMAGTNPTDSASAPVQAVCTRMAPSLSITPIKQAANAGLSLSYALSVKNNDSAACAAATIQFEPTYSAGLSGQIAMQSFVLSPGQSSSTSLSVMSASTALAGDYSFTVKAINNSATSLFASVTGTYTVNAQPVCTRAAPLLTLAPMSQSGFAGENLIYTINVKNNDSSVCAASVYSVSSMLSANLSGQLSVSTLNILPGQSAAATLKVMSAVNAPIGDQTFSVSVSDAIVAIHSAQVQGIYVVKSPADLKPPTVPANVMYEKSKSAYLLSWSPSTDDTAVVKYRIYVNGALKAETDTTSFKIRLHRGINDIQISAVDAAGNESALSVKLSIEK